MESETLTYRTGSSDVVLDLTEDCREFVAGRGDGLLNVFVPHATAGIAVIETGAGSDDDLLAALGDLLPVFLRTGFMYDDWEGTSNDECLTVGRCVGETVTVQVPASTFTTATPPPAAVRGALGKALTPTGAAAKIGSILKTGSSAADLNAPSAGRATIVWKRAGGAASVLARGAKTVDRAGKAVVKVSLTPAGKVLLRQAKRTKSTVRVKATGSFTPKGGKKVAQTKIIKLR